MPKVLATDEDGADEYTAAAKMVATRLKTTEIINAKRIRPNPPLDRNALAVRPRRMFIVVPSEC